MSSRVPHGTRGLKSVSQLFMQTDTLSRPAWDAWIEIMQYGGAGVLTAVASRMGRVD